MRLLDFVGFTDMALARMAEPMQIVIDEATHQLMGDDFACSELGVHDLKGFGEQQVWSVEDERARHEGFRPGL